MNVKLDINTFTDEQLKQLTKKQIERNFKEITINNKQDKVDNEKFQAARNNIEGKSVLSNVAGFSSSMVTLGELIIILQMKKIGIEIGSFTSNTIGCTYGSIPVFFLIGNYYKSKLKFAKK